MTDPNAAPEPTNPNADGSSGNPNGSGVEVPIAQPKIIAGRQTRISWIWLVPLVAALVGLSLLVKGWIEIGPTITISFESAEGLEVGQTKLRYKNVVVGQVTVLTVAQERSWVLLTSEFNLYIDG
jgi:paraquat-inducible protein B